MGLKEKALDMIKNASYTALEMATTKINEEINNQKQKEKKFIDEFPYKHKYLIKQNDTTSIDAFFFEILERDSYVIFNADNYPVYLAQGSVLFGKHCFTLTDTNKKVVAKINKALVNVPIPLMKDRKSCSIELSGETPFSMETYESFKEDHYTISKTGFSIKSDSNNEFKIMEHKKKKPIIHIHRVRSIETLLHDKYIVGFDDEASTVLAIAITIGLDAIRFSD